VRNKERPTVSKTGKLLVIAGGHRKFRELTTCERTNSDGIKRAFLSEDLGDELKEN